MSTTKVLIVDDEPYLIEALKYILKKEGYQVSTAVDGVDALQKIAENKPDVMFLDIMMPRKNGYELCETLKQIPELKDIYIILLSAKAWEADKEKGLSLGANDFLSKPYSPKDAISALKKAEDRLALVKS
jgi:CheY-like chemotaxis protein